MTVETVGLTIETTSVGLTTATDWTTGAAATVTTGAAWATETMAGAAATVTTDERHILDEF